MDVTEEGVLDTGRGHINDNGAIYGFKKYAGHECRVLVFPQKKHSPMPEELKKSLGKALEVAARSKVVRVEDCPFGATDSGVPGTVFHMESGEKIWMSDYNENGCIDIEEEVMHYCNDCPWGFLPESNECRTHVKEHGRKLTIK